MIPIFILTTWLLGTLSVVLVASVAYLFHEWIQLGWKWDPVLKESVFAPAIGWNGATMLLTCACLLALIAIAGGPMMRLIQKLICRTKSASDPDPRIAPKSIAQQRLHRPDGSELHVEFYGDEKAIQIVLTHGWGLNSREWNYLIRDLSKDFRLIVWDEPGLGQSTRSKHNDFSLDKMSHDLEAVLDLAGTQPAFLLGHSIGGMITLTFCRLFPQVLQKRVAGLVLAHTTPTNPIRTTSGAAFFTAIEKPILFPLMYLTIFLSPLVWLMNWLSYLNGSAHLCNQLSSFGGTETWEQVAFATDFQPKASPAVLARGMLAMMRYDATSVLPNIPVPTLVVTGDKDSTTKPEAGETIRQGIPNAKLATLTPAKHLGLIEHRDAFAKIVREFGDSVTGIHTRETKLSKAI